MPRNNTVAEAKYSNLSMHHILSAPTSANPQPFHVTIEGRTGGVTDDAFNYQFFHSERHPLTALGRSVAKFFYYHPAGRINQISIRKTR